MPEFINGRHKLDKWKQRLMLYETTNCKEYNLNSNNSTSGNGDYISIQFH